MGSVCCCPSQEDFEEYTSYPNGCIYQHCLCLKCCVRWFLHMVTSCQETGFRGCLRPLLVASWPSLYSALFYRVEGHDVPSSMQGVTPSIGLLVVSSPDSSPPDTYRAPPRPLPYDSDPRYVRVQRDGLVSRRDKSGSHLHGESEPLRRTNSDGDGEPLTNLQRRNAVGYDAEGQGYLPESPRKRQSLKAMMRIESTQSLGGDEDVCPTCLDGYNTENPKIPTQCGHHFHLGCIYEWMERSKNCPVCDKEMVFTENP